jgi:DNA (cytosine-5)-methyltransferase 1
LVEINILKTENYAFIVNDYDTNDLSEEEKLVLSCNQDDILVLDKLKTNRTLKVKNISISKTVKSLEEKKILICDEVRYDFKNTKISTGLYGVNRIFLPSSNIFPTLVASDTNDFVTLKEIEAKNEDDYKEKFLKEVYQKGDYRRITKEEACLIQGFPKDYILPENRARWMKLLGNSVSVPVIEVLAKAIIDTGVFDSKSGSLIYKSPQKEVHTKSILEVQTML